MLKVALKDLLARKRRLVTTGIAIVLGIAFMTGTQLLSSTLQRLHQVAWSATSTQGIDAVVRSPDTQETPFGQPIRDPVPASLVPGGGRGRRRARRRGRAWSPPARELVDAKGKVYGGGFGPPTLVYNWITTRRSGWASSPTDAARRPTTRSRSTSRPPTAWGSEVGDEITLATTQQGTETFTLVGMVGLGEDGTESSGAR